MHSRGSHWCLFLELQSNEGNKHQINTRVRHSSTYIILFLTQHNKSIDDDKNMILTHRLPIKMTSQCIVDNVSYLRPYSWPIMQETGVLTTWPKCNDTFCCISLRGCFTLVLNFTAVYLEINWQYTYTDQAYSFNSLPESMTRGSIHAC